MIRANACIGDIMSCLSLIYLHYFCQKIHDEPINKTVTIKVLEEMKVTMKIYAYFI